MNGKDGSTLWSYPVRNSIKNSIAIDGDIVFAQDAQGFCMPLIPKRQVMLGKANWPVNGLPALIDGLVADEGMVYAGTGKGTLCF